MPHYCDKFVFYYYKLQIHCCYFRSNYMALWVKRCTVKLHAVGSNPVHTCVCGTCFPRQGGSPLAVYFRCK